MFAENAKYGVQMAGAGAQQPTTRLGKIGQTLDGAGVGIWATLKNFKGLRSGTKKGNTGFVNDVLEASTNGGMLGVLKNSGSGGRPEKCSGGVRKRQSGWTIYRQDRRCCGTDSFRHCRTERS